MSNDTDGSCQNTDRELWREREGDFYADSIHVTQDGHIGINCGGHVIVMPLRKWHEAAQSQPPSDAPTAGDTQPVAPGTVELLRWAYSKLLYRSFDNMDDALAMDEIKLILTHPDYTHPPAQPAGEGEVEAAAHELLRMLDSAHPREDVDLELMKLVCRAALKRTA